ncbi:type II toxin-antitoxin system PemK/MazF family toxin [Arthrobacter oryzae]|uniref:type II toxin-antitoxin system PemK/MazF family toxin n=1 Tax=Arthrobacter oryzae TaxID=409290 RepID=UPI0028580C94|nr:type II toxin-antitoxin system PemK/MazF family toxin [Arthrobacter oryzae]MDR6505832.1 hypothetical protein [Arthrobacter oryzae]
MALNLRSLANAVRAAIRFLEGRPGKDRPGGQPQVPAAQGSPTPRRRPTPGDAPQPRAAAGGAAGGISGKYPGDFQGVASVKYAPSPNGKPEPGEVVWTWVPYEEDHSQGKDRPVLLIGSRGRFLLGLMLTSKDHDHDRRDDDNYVDIGTGSWDRQHRPSEAKLDRILQIRPADIRREGAVLDRKRFNSVSAALRELHGWS